MSIKNPRRAGLARPDRVDRQRCLCRIWRDPQASTARLRLEERNTLTQDGITVAASFWNTEKSRFFFLTEENGSAISSIGFEDGGFFERQNGRAACSQNLNTF